MKTFIPTLIWCLPVSGLLFIISVFLRGQVFDISDTTMFLSFATGATFQLGATWNLFNFIFLFLGVIGLGLYIIETTDKTVSKIAFVLLFIAHCLTFCYLGLLAFVYHKAASLYPTNPDILTLFDLSKNPAILPVVIIDTITYVTGTVLTTYILFRSRLIPAWTSLLFGLSFFMVGVIPPAMLTVNPDITRLSELAGNLCILISGYSIARTVSKQMH